MRLVCLLSIAVVLMLGQTPDDFPPLVNRPDRPRDIKLPNGKSQPNEIAKADYKKNLKEAAELVELSQNVKEALENGDQYVVSLQTIKKLDDIEKLSRNIRGRLKRN